MAALPYMQLYVADYLADTMHLTTEEHGAYLLLIFNYWQTGKPLPKRRLHRIARVSTDQWPEIERALSEFFEDDGENWIHLRIERDIELVLTSPRGKKLPGGDSLSGYKGYVYFVTEPGNELVKIGYSKNPWARLNELRRSHGEALSVVATIKTVEKSEVSVHEVLAEFRSGGEWFKKSTCINALISTISDGKVTTVAEISSYVASYRNPATPTTNTDTDTDTDTEAERELYAHANELIPLEGELQPGSPQRQEPGQADPQEDPSTAPFAMFLEWKPARKRLGAMVLRAGLSMDLFDDEGIGGFVIHHQAKGLVKAEDEWLAALVGWRKRDYTNGAAVRAAKSPGGEDVNFDSHDWLEREGVKA